MVATGFGSVVAFAPGFIATELRADLGIDRWQVGMVITVHFAATALGMVGSGRIADRWGARLSVVVALWVVALSAGVAAVFGSLAALFVASVPAGFGYALVNVGTTVAAAGAAGARRRAVALAARTAGVPAVGALSSGAGPWVANRWGWEWVFAGLGAAAAVVGLIAAVVLPDDNPGRSPRQRRRLPGGFVWFAVAAFLLVFGTQPMYSWSVPYLQESLGATPALAGLLVGMASAVGAGVMIVGGLGVDRAGPSRRITLAVTFSAATALSGVLILAGASAGVGVATLGVVGGISLQLLSIGTMQAAFVDRADGAVARATGVTMTGYYLGAVAAPTTFGAVVDATGTYSWAWVVGALLLVGAAGAFRMAGRIPLRS